MDATSEPLNRHDNLEVGHERSDVSIRGILVFGVGLFIAAVVIHLLMWWLFNYFAARAEKSGRPLPALMARDATESVPPEPRLQVSPPHDLQEMRVAEEAILHNYGWVDQQTSTVRIPVERAMQILAERGLPVQLQTEDSEAENRGSGEPGKPENR